MVVLNFTLLVELGLFLVFLWLASRLIIRPAVETADKREATIRGELDAAKAMRKEAAGALAEYEAAIAGARRESAIAINRARQQALTERAEAIAARQREGVKAVAAVRKEARAAIEAQRDQYDALAPGLAEAMARRVVHGKEPA